MDPTRLRRWFGAAALLLLAGLAGRAEAQETYTITGTVVDATSQRPVGGVSVSIRNTPARTVTDPSGRFTLRAPLAPGSYAVAFAALGRATTTRTVTLAAAREVALGTVPLSESVIQLDEVVVTGTGIPTERRELGNSVATVRGDEINEAPAASGVDAALQGRIAGATISENSGQPGGGISIRLRGTSTIFGGAEPLIVVDGVIIDNNDAALVGLSSNAGRGGSALSNRLADIAPGDIERVEVLKGAAAAALYGSRANSGVIQIFTKRGREGRPVISVNTEFSTSATPNRLALNMSPLAGYTDVLFVRRDLAAGDSVERFDLQDQIFRRGYGVNLDLSISGGSAETSYYLSGSNRDETGILQATDYSRTTVRGKLTQQVSRIFELSANGAFVQSRVNHVPEGEQTFGLLTTIIFTPTTFNPERDPITGRFPRGPVQPANALDVIANWESPEEVVRMIGGLEATARLHPSLTVRGMFGIDDYRQESRFFRPPLSVSASDGGQVSNPVRFSRQTNTELTASHDLGLGSGTLNSTAGFRYTENAADVISASATNLPPGQELVGGGTQFASQSFSEVRTVGGYLQERLSFRDRLFLTGGLNVEGSSAFGEDVRWQLFPRFGVSWVLHEEPFWASSPAGPIFNTLRVRAAYGETGSQPPGAYLRFENYVDLAYSGESGYVASTTVGNPLLAPERQREYEAGLEAGFLNDRALLDITYYDQLTSDLVLPVPVAPSLGASQQFQNVGAISNRGIEATLTTLNVTGSRLAWRTRFTYSMNRNRVQRLAPDIDTLQVASLGGDYLNAVILGQPLGVFVGGVYERDASGNIVYRPVTVGGNTLMLPSRARDTITINGVTTTPFARRVIGNPHPDFQLAVSNEFDIGERAQLSFLLDGRFGNDVANFTRRITELFGVDQVVEREISGDTVARTYSLNPASRSGIYEEYIEDGSFVKLREITLRYQLAGGLAQRFGADRAEIRLAGRNLYTWTKYSGLDPEVNLFSNNAVARGVDFATTPIPRTFVLGLNFSF